MKVHPVNLFLVWSFNAIPTVFFELQEPGGKFEVGSEEHASGGPESKADSM